MRIHAPCLVIGLFAFLPAANAQPEKVPAKDAWLYAHSPQMPRKIPKESFDKVRIGMTLEEMVKLLGKAWMRPNSSIRDIYWGCADGRVIRVNPSTLNRDEKTIKNKKDELTPGSTIQMYREKGETIVDIPIPLKEEKNDKK